LEIREKEGGVGGGASRQPFTCIKGRGIFLYNVYPPVILDIYAIVVKPRKDLEIKYPCDVKMEDGAIVVIDRERAERVTEER